MESGLAPVSAPGMTETVRNLITDVPGIKIGHAEDARLGSGATAIVFDEPAVASIDVRGGGPGTRETALLDPAQTVEGIDAITLAGGSAFGLDAASGVQAWLREQGRGFAVRTARVPIVPAAILFDLLAAATRTGAGFRPIATSAMQRRPPQRVAISPSAASAQAPARPPSITKAESARPRRRRPTATSSVRWPSSTPPAAS